MMTIYLEFCVRSVSLWCMIFSTAYIMTFLEFMMLQEWSGAICALIIIWVLLMPGVFMLCKVFEND